ncbi:hypothetical protein [Croceicoccus sp. BE223]|uniref:head-tail connector protein n=1 Tax=Croceicoccus sp. BE223 TaxID=2817716 RepID=UPI0028554364|nr:hypothetical protein [Croceicoccus sp. BE223]MDR7102988.1 putative phiE125 gp8 family phage protein [Croceicoccus sp. BE223]
MIFELQHVPMADGYGEALLPLAECKAWLSIGEGETEFDDLIAVLRDAAIEFVERYCEVKLLETAGQVWTGEAFPGAGARLSLGLRPVVSIAGVTWLDGSGAEVTGTIGDFRLLPGGEVVAAIGGSWPSDVGGGVSITFTAGYAEGEAPKALLTAAKRFMAYLYMHREAVIVGAVASEAPLGVTALCAPYRRVRI